MLNTSAGQIVPRFIVWDNMQKINEIKKMRSKIFGQETWAQENWLCTVVRIKLWKNKSIF